MASQPVQHFEPLPGWIVRINRPVSPAVATDLAVLLKAAVESEKMAPSLPMPSYLKAIGGPYVSGTHTIPFVNVDGPKSGIFDMEVTDKGGIRIFVDWEIQVDNRTVQATATWRGQNLGIRTPSVVQLGKLPKGTQPLIPDIFLSAMATDGSPPRVAIGYIEEVRELFNAMSKHTR